MLAGRLNVRSLEFSVQEVRTPVPGPGEVRIKVGAAGVCLSDVHLISGLLKPLYLLGESVTLGHEVAGTVDLIGPEVSQWTPGQRVLLQAGETRGSTVFTRGVDYDGGWAEYALARQDTVVAIGDELPFEQACFIPDAVSTPWAAITSTAAAKPAQSAGIWGVGGLGAHAVQLLRAIGVAPIIAIDPLPAARERALLFGADHALDPADKSLHQTILHLTGGLGLQLAFDFAGVAAVREQAIACLGKLGKLVLVGLTDKPVVISNGTMFSYLEQQVLGHYGSLPEHLDQLVRLVQTGRVEFSRSVSEILPLTRAAEAVEHLTSKLGNPIRIVLQP